MEAKDTVMDTYMARQISIEVLGLDKVAELGNSDTDMAYAIGQIQRQTSEKQAEISFKAGRKSMLNDIEDGDEDIGDIIDSLCQEAIMAALRNGKQEGIKEVVEWVLSESDYDCGHFIFGFDIDQDIWNGKLQEWGIEKPYNGLSVY